MRNPVKPLSDGLAVVERIAAGVAAGLVAGLILVNVVTRSLDVAIYGIDEAAVFAMIWMAFLGASVTFKHREQVAVTLVTGSLPVAWRRPLHLAVDMLVLGFGVMMIVLCWIWYQPVTLILTGFDLDAFAQATANFIYDQPTRTLGIAKFWVWLVLPVFAVDLTIHALSNLLDTAAGGSAAAPGAS